MTSTRSDKQIKAGLHRIKVLRAWTWGVWLAFLPLFFLYGIFQIPGWLTIPIGLLWLCSWFVMALISLFSRCPACHNFFFLKGNLLFGNVFTRKCLNCGIPLNYREKKSSKDSVKANGDVHKNIN